MSFDSDFDTNVFPLAYLITIRCYGTWLHGDARGSVDRRLHNKYQTPGIAPNREFEKSEKQRLKHSPFKLEAENRKTVEIAICEVCSHRGYNLRAINVRTNHVHTVVSAACKPEGIMSAFKAYATRRLREKDCLSEKVVIWARHGSTIYLWKEPDVEQAVKYVLETQGDELSKFQ